MISIYEKIENKGANDANEIYQEGKRKSQDLEQTSIKDAQVEIDEIINTSLSRKQDSLRTKTTELEQLAKKRLLTTKKELIDHAFDSVYQKLMQLDDQELFDIIVKMIRADNINGDEMLVVSKEDHPKFLRVFSSGKKNGELYLLDKLNQVLGENYQLKLANEFGKLKGGFIIVGKKYDINHSFKTILNHIKDQNEAQIARILFENEG